MKTTIICVLLGYIVGGFILTPAKQLCEEKHIAQLQKDSTKQVRKIDSLVTAIDSVKNSHLKFLKFHSKKADTVECMGTVYLNGKNTFR